MKIGVSSYSFKDYLNKKITAAEMIKKAKEIGYDEIEFVDFNPPDGTNVIEYAVSVRDLCRDSGISVAAYTCGADFLNGSGGDQKKELERLKGCVDIAEIIGAGKMRHDSTYNGGGLTYIQAVDKMAPYIRELAGYAESKGIRTMTENHGYFMQESYRVEYLIAKVNHPNYGALIDIGNFICADEDPIQAVSRLAPMAFHAHAKDFKHKVSNGNDSPPDGWGTTRGGNFIVGTIVGRGDMPVVKCLKILKKAGYNGCLGLEFEGLEDNMTALVEGHKFLRETIEKL